MSKVISIIGGNGYVGSRITEILLSSVKDIKIYSISRNVELHSLSKFDDRVERIKGDVLTPEKFSSYLQKSTGVIYTVGKLISLQKPEEEGSYKSLSYDSAIKVAKICDDFSTLSKKNFVYISAERGLMFPFSLAFGGYIQYKRKAEEELIRYYPHLKPVILRPGLITDTKERPYLAPLSIAFNASNFLEKNLIGSLIPNIGEKVGLPSSSIALDSLSVYAAAGALGKLNNKIYSNEYMNDLSNMKDINLD